MECSASIASTKKNRFQFASGRCTETISCRCGTELSVLEQVGSVVIESSSCASEEASMDQEQEDEVSSGGEPAMLLRAPQNATALVGDRVLLKVTYMGHPEPNVRWTRAVSKQNHFFPFMSQYLGKTLKKLENIILYTFFVAPLVTGTAFVLIDKQSRK